MGLGLCWEHEDNQNTNALPGRLYRGGTPEQDEKDSNPKEIKSCLKHTPGSKNLMPRLPGRLRRGAPRRCLPGGAGEGAPRRKIKHK